MLNPIQFSKKLFGFNRKQVINYISEIDDKVLHLQEHNNRLDADNVELIIKARELSKNYNDLQQNANARIEQMRQMLIQANETAEQAFERLESSSYDRETFEKRVVALNDIVAQARTAVSMADQKLGQLKIENDRLEYENRHLKTEAEQLRYTATLSTERLDIATNESVHLRAKYDEAYAKAAQATIAEDRLNAVTAENQSLTQQLNESNIEIGALTAKIDELLAENAQIATELDEYRRSPMSVQKQELQDLMANAKTQADALLCDAKVKAEGILGSSQEAHETIQRAKESLLDVMQKFSENVANTQVNADGAMNEAEILKAESELLAKNLESIKSDLDGEDEMPESKITHIRNVGS